MKHSIRMRYTSVLVLALTAIIGCVVLFNCFYLESYVTSQRRRPCRRQFLWWKAMWRAAGETTRRLP